MSQRNLEGNETDAGEDEEDESSGWELFDGYNELFVSIRKNGSLSIYSTAYEEFFEGNEAVKLFYNDKTGEVGIKPVEEYRENVDGIMKLSQRNENGGAISTKSFVKKYGIGDSTTRKYEADWNEEQNMLTFDPSQSGKDMSKSNNSS